MQFRRRAGQLYFHNPILPETLFFCTPVRLKITQTAEQSSAQNLLARDSYRIANLCVTLDAAYLSTGVVENGITRLAWHW